MSSSNSSPTQQNVRNAVPKTSMREHATGTPELQPTRDIVQYVREYARQKPDVAALWCFGIGIVVGWKARPW